MPGIRPRILYVTDLGYQANGWRYGDEDILLSAALRQHFVPSLCHPADAVAHMADFDAVVIRNSGPVLHYQEQYDIFREAARAAGTRVYNPLAGRADMVGKQYLVDLSATGYPVIPTVDRVEDLSRLPEVPEYVLKPKTGSDSIGMDILPAHRITQSLTGTADGDVLLQPLIPFRYEVSFYFVDQDFQYALYAPDPLHRWKLTTYQASDADVRFARRFIDWNGLDHGIQRVDACRTPDGELLLVELEDLNPYLSLTLLEQPVRDAFIARMTASLHDLLR